MTEPQEDLPPALAAAAEEVRAYLVALRGGAPFLSGPDGRLLVDWLDAGVSVGLILASLDRAAERRRRRPARSRLTLQAIKGEIKKQLKLAADTGRAAPPPSAPSGAGWPALRGYAEEISALPVAPQEEAARAALVGVLARLGREGGADLDAVAREAMAACRAFHEAAWESLAAERAELLAAAAAELAGLRDVLSEEALAAAVEEVARDKVRARTPLVAARVVWDRLTGAE